MTTPASGQISFGDLKSELSLVGGPSSDISLAYAAHFVMADGFWDTYGFTGQTSYSSAPVKLSYFYDLQTDASFDFQVDSSITDYADFFSTLTNISYVGGNVGPYAQPSQYTNPQSSVIQPGTSNAEPIVHMQELNVLVNCYNIIIPPTPPFTDLYMDWNNGGGFTPFAGSPFNGPSISVNSGIQDNAPNNVGTPTFEVRCYQ